MCFPKHIGNGRKGERGRKNESLVITQVGTFRMDKIATKTMTKGFYIWTLTKLVATQSTVREFLVVKAAFVLLGEHFWAKTLGETAQHFQAVHSVILGQRSIFSSKKMFYKAVIKDMCLMSSQQPTGQTMRNHKTMITPK